MKKTDLKHLCINNEFSQCTKQEKNKQIRYQTKTATNFCQNFDIFVTEEG